MRTIRWFCFLLALGAGLLAGSAYAEPAPTDLLLAAEEQREAGNYPAAITLYQKTLDAAGAAPDAENAPAARTALYRLAQTYGMDLNYAAALEAWTRFLTLYPNDARRPVALLQQANALRDMKNMPGAYLAYQAYRATAPSDDPLLPYLAMGIGQGYYDTGQYALAVGEFALVMKAGDVLPTARALAAQRYADAISRTANYTDAVTAYDNALALAPTPSARSQIEVGAARALKETGRTSEAVQRLKRVLSESPSGDAAPQAVEMLQALAPAELNFYHAGLAFYYRRQYDTAAKWFHRHLDEQYDLDLAHYYAAKSYELSSQQDKAIREWTSLITTHPTSGKVVEALFERADDYARLGQDATAIRQYQDLAAKYPNTAPYAENSLFAIGRLYETAGKYLEAAKNYEALAARYPNGARASEALAAAGYMRYRANDFAGARATFQRLAGYPVSTWKARGLFWLGKTQQKLGAPGDARESWVEAAEVLPGDYYSARAADMAAGTVPTGTDRRAPMTAPDFPGAQLEMERWLKSWAMPPDDPREERQRMSSLRSDLASDGRMVRARLLLEAGFRAEGRAELRALAETYRNDPIAQYQLSLVFRELGQHDLVIRAGYRILDLSPANGITTAPEYLQRMIYPAPFGPLVGEQSQKNGLDPLLFYALMWQESQFDPLATSSVGARGLGQVMPGTGTEIARWLNRSNFKIDELYKPYVSIEFGTTYLARTLAYVDRDFMMALAGYNGGPGNAAKWKQADVDLAVEGIGLSESKTYVKRVYQHYWFYRRLYGQTSAD